MEADTIRPSEPLGSLERHVFMEQGADEVNLLRRLARVYFEEEVEEVIEEQHGMLAPTYGRTRVLEEDETVAYWQNQGED